MSNVVIRRGKPPITVVPEPPAQEPSKPYNGLLLPTGSTLLNLALSDRWNGGWMMGTVANLIGDSSSGKSILANTTLAEAAHRPQFDEHELVLDNTEWTCGFDMVKLFGHKTAERVVPPRVSGDERYFSATVEEFYANVQRRLKAGRPFIYILDSLDAVSDYEERAKMDELVNTFEKRDGEDLSQEEVKKIKATMGMRKAKFLSQSLRQLNEDMARTQSLLIIVSQTRDKTETFGWGNPQTRAGGRALEFYASTIFWTSIIKKLENANKYNLGVLSEADVTKNRCTGKRRSITFPIYYDLGIDDIGACVDFLVEEAFWPASKNGIVDAAHIEAKGYKAAILEKIEENNLEDYVRELTGWAWGEVEARNKINRKPRWTE